MKTELWKQSYRAAKRILSYRSYHFWVMSYGNRELNYGNKPSKQPLSFGACKCNRCFHVGVFTFIVLFTNTQNMNLICRKIINNFFNNNPCGSGKFTIRPKLYLGQGPVPRRYIAEDEWSTAGVSRGTAEKLLCPRHSKTSMGRSTSRWRLPPNGPLKGIWVEWGPQGSKV